MDLGSDQLRNVQALGKKMMEELIDESGWNNWINCSVLPSWTSTAYIPADKMHEDICMTPVTEHPYQ